MRSDIGDGPCAGSVPALQQTAARLSQGGLALLPDLAAAQLLLARCQQPTGDGAAAQTRAAAAATLARLHYLPRRLRAERRR